MIDNSTKVISLDFWRTIAKPNPRFNDERIKLLSKYFEVDKPTVKSIFFKVEKIAEKQIDANGQQFGFEDRIILMASFLGVDLYDFKEDLYSELESLFLNFSPTLMESELGSAMAEHHQNGLKFGLISNTGFIKGETLTNWLKSVHLLSYFDFLVYSDEHGVGKPNSRLFDVFWKETKVQKENILHIGDNPICDYDGATSFGFNALLFRDNRREKQVNSICEALQSFNLVG